MNICGEIKLTSDEIIDKYTAVPKRSEILKHDRAVNPVWKPISHSTAISALMVAFEATGIEAVECSFALNSTGNLLVGGFLVQGDCLPMVPKSIDGQYELFIRHANDMSRALTLTAGMQLFVCTNGMMTGSQIARHKHVESFDMQQWAIDEAMPGFIDACSGLDESVNLLQQTPVSDAQAHRLILEAGHQGILPLARTVDVYREWSHPTYGEADFASGTAWKLYHNFTHIAQRTSPQRQLQIIEGCYDLIVSNLVGETAIAA